MIKLQQELDHDLVKSVELAKKRPDFNIDKTESIRKTATAKVSRIAGKLCSARVFDENYGTVDTITCEARECPFYPDGPAQYLQD